MFKEVSQSIDKMYDQFQSLTPKTLMFNGLLSVSLKEMRWLPAFVTGTMFAFSSSVANFLAEDIIKIGVPVEYKHDFRTYFHIHPQFHVIYYITFLALIFVGTAALTQLSLPLFGRSCSMSSMLVMTALDFLPYSYQEISLYLKNSSKDA